MLGEANSAGVLGAVAEVLLDLLAEVAETEDHPPDAVAAEQRKLVVDERLARQFDQRLGDRIGERTQPLAATRREQRDQGEKKRLFHRRQCPPRRRYALPAARAKYRQPEQWQQFFDQATARLRGQPAVESAAVVVSLPMRPVPLARSWPVSVVGGPELPPSQQPIVQGNIVSPEFFHVLRIPLLEGRNFSVSDRLGSTPVVVISTVARNPNHSSDMRRWRVNANASAVLS